jgi:hypothetical protein
MTLAREELLRTRSERAAGKVIASATTDGRRHANHANGGDSILFRIS